MGMAEKRAMADLVPVTPERVLQVRLQHDLTQAELAEWVGVNGSTVSRWESGESSPRGKTLARFNEIFRGEHENNADGQGRRDQDAVVGNQ
jgi:DNA-binding transcriptional regulator YiaG